MRFPALLLIPVAVAACAPTVPDSGAGVGFQDYNAYMNQRDGGMAPRNEPIVPPGFSTETIGAAIDRAGAPAQSGNFAPSTSSAPSSGAVIGASSYTPVAAAPMAQSASRPRGNAPMGIVETTSEMTARAGGGANISDEQDFGAVSARETIASDKARIERNRSQYQVIQPGALPTRPGAAGPNIVDYALATSHPKGTQMYTRTTLFGGGNAAGKCAGYASPDLAQEAFLARGGPERDRLGLDSDGDGYACAWDPSPYRIR